MRYVGTLFTRLMCLFWDWGSFDFLVHKITFLVNNDIIQNEKNPIGPNSIKTTNAGLGHTADILEEMFTNAEFPATATSLGTSLQQGGKSRADLWTFASAVAVEWGLDRNNNACDGSDTAGDGVSSSHGFKDNHFNLY